MQHITELDQLNNLKSQGALFILFGGEHCSVCRSLKPQLVSIIAEQFSEMQAVYVDCEKSPEICAQHSVFSLPVVMAYIDGMKVVEMARVFSIGQLVDSIQRPYELWKNQSG
jgi:thioredoxin-like negative regulator of GroEL